LLQLHLSYKNINPQFYQTQGLHPQVVNLNRKVVFSTAMLTSATSLVEKAADMTHAPKSEYERHFNQAELTVLQNHLDLHYSIQMP